MSHLAALTESLELVAARSDDPAPAVYARLFAARPDVEPLFIRDRSGIIRGQMLQVTIETLLDLADDGVIAPGMLQTERVNHQGLGVPEDAFDSFYRVLHATFRDIGGEGWTGEMEGAWVAMIARAVATAQEGT